MDATEQRQAMLTVEKFKVRSNSPRWLISCIDAVRTCLRISRRVSGLDEEGRFVPYIAFFLSYHTDLIAFRYSSYFVTSWDARLLNSEVRMDSRGKYYPAAPHGASGDSGNATRLSRPRDCFTCFPRRLVIAVISDYSFPVSVPSALVFLLLSSTVPPLLAVPASAFGLTQVFWISVILAYQWG